MEASPPLSNAGPRKKTQTKVASEQALAWSGLPVVTIRPTVFLEGFFLPLTGPSVRNRGRIELPFGRGKTSPVATADVARVVAAVLADPGPHLGRIYELTGPQSQNMHGVAREYLTPLSSSPRARSKPTTSGRKPTATLKPSLLWEMGQLGVT
jgi:uncharacterized protein YbjT (DUF2867 family)